MNISTKEAQELHECIGASLAAIKSGGELNAVKDLERALELARLVVSDSEQAVDEMTDLAEALTDVLLTRDEEAEGLSTTEDLLDSIAGLENYLASDYTNEDDPPRLSI